MSRMFRRSVAPIAFFASVAWLAGCGGGQDSSAFSPDAGDDAFVPGNDDAGADGSSDGGGACTPGKTDTQACGKCGSQLRVCNSDSKWSDWSACTGETGACVAGETETETCDDGRKRTRTCSETCSWGAFGACEGEPWCTPGASEKGTCGNCGEQFRICGADKTWSDWSACTKEGECAPGAVGEEACGVGGKRSRTCSASCSWGAFGTCIGSATPCTPGAIEQDVCGKCGERVRVCGADKSWSDWSACDKEGVCSPGAVEEQTCGGTGKQTRTCTSACGWGGWGTCVGGTPSATEIWAARVTSGTAGNAVAVLIDRIRITDSVVVGSIGLPTTASGANQPLTLSDSSTSDGQLVLSGDGRYVTLAGYALNPGTPNVSTTSAPRVLARINASGVVDTVTTTTSMSGAAIRGAGSADGSSFYAFNGTALVRVPYGPSSGGATITSGDVGLAGFFGGLLHLTKYQSSGGTILYYPTAPTSTVTPTMLIDTNPSSGGFSVASPYGMWATSLSGAGIDRVYVADDRSTEGGVEQWSRTGGTWTKVKTIRTGLASGEVVRYVTGVVRGSEVIVFGTVDGSSSSRILSWADDGTATSPAAKTVRNAPAGSEYRGVSAAPK